MPASRRRRPPKCLHGPLSPKRAAGGFREQISTGRSSHSSEEAGWNFAVAAAGRPPDPMLGHIKRQDGTRQDAFGMVYVAVSNRPRQDLCVEPDTTTVERARL